jgi:hypothetical protein
MLTEIENAIRCELVVLNAPKGDALQVGDLADHGNNGLTVIGSHQPNPFSGETHLEYALENGHVKKHIYLTSDEAIQIFDFYIERTGLGNILQRMTEEAFKDWNSTPDKLLRHINRCRKVVATTDPKLNELNVGEISSHFVQYFAGQPLGLINRVDYYHVEEYSGGDPVPFIRPYVRPAFPTLVEAAAEFFEKSDDRPFNIFNAFKAGAEWFAQFGGRHPNVQSY